MPTEFCVMDPDWPSDYCLKAELLANQFRRSICGFPAGKRDKHPCHNRPIKGGIRCGQHKNSKLPPGFFNPNASLGNLLADSREIAKSPEIFNLRPAIASAKWLLRREEEAYQEYYAMREELRSPYKEPTRKRQIERQLFPILDESTQKRIAPADSGEKKPLDDITDEYIGWLHKRLEDLRKTIEFQVGNLANIVKRAAETEKLTKDLISRTDADSVLIAVGSGYAEAIREELPPEQAESLLVKIEQTITNKIRPLLDKRVVNDYGVKKQESGAEGGEAIKNGEAVALRSLKKLKNGIKRGASRKAPAKAPAKRKIKKKRKSKQKAQYKVSHPKPTQEDTA